MRFFKFEPNSLYYNKVNSPNVWHKLLQYYFPSDIKIGFNTYNKPLALNYNNLYFNKSHSSNLLALAISNQYQVGVDIQYWKKLDYIKFAKRFFSQTENFKLSQNHDNSYIKNTFFDIWCKKESYLKMLGTGINQDLSSIDYTGGNFFFCQDFKDYSICLCLQELNS